MLSAEGCRTRRRRLFDALQDRPDWIVVSEPRHLMYLANFYAPPFIFRTQNASAVLILGADGASTLVTDNMLGVYAAKAHVDERITAEWYNGRTSAPERQSVLVRAAAEVMLPRRRANFGFDQMVPPALCLELAGTHDGTPTGSINPALQALMRRKDPDEIDVLRRIVSAMESGFTAAVAGIRPGTSELDAYALVCGAVNTSLGEQALIYGDFASGSRTEEKGGPPTSRVVRQGELFLLDYSAVLYGYRADFSNTWVVDGEPTSRQRELERCCIKAMDAGEQQLRPGRAGRDVDAALRDVFTRHRALQYFPHHSGHGVGLGHPEPPYLTPQSDDHLVAGDVVTLEPGLYESGVGGMRFERNYLITASGFELLTRHHIGLTPGSPRFTAGA